MRAKRESSAAARALLGLLLLGILLSLSATGAGERKAGPEAKPKPRPTPVKAEAPKERETVQRRVIGSILFPERGNVKRESSALKIITPEVIEITKKAMDYVRSSQRSDGSWGDKQFPKSSGVTALCCMAMLAEGSLPKVGYSGGQLDKGIEFLLSCGKEDGLLVAKDTYKYGPMYDHTWATYVLLQVYGNAPWHQDMRTKISRAIQAMLRAQKPDGGWRYTISPLGRSDVSVTASVLATLRLARLSGFAVPEERISRGEKFIERCGKPRREGDKGTFCYREGGERGNASTTSAGLLGLFSRGLYDHEYVKPCTENIAYVYRRAHIADLKDSPRFRYFHFGCYYVSQVMYQAGDEYWIPWYRKTVSVLKETQKEGGYFSDRYGNKVYPTAISALVLQAPLGYMPQYLR